MENKKVEDMNVNDMRLALLHIVMTYKGSDNQKLMSQEIDQVFKLNDLYEDVIKTYLKANEPTEETCCADGPDADASEKKECTNEFCCSTTDLITKEAMRGCRDWGKEFERVSNFISVENRAQALSEVAQRAYNDLHIYAVLGGNPAIHDKLTKLIDEHSSRLIEEIKKEAPYTGKCCKQEPDICEPILNVEKQLYFKPETYDQNGIAYAVVAFKEHYDVYEVFKYDGDFMGSNGYYYVPGWAVESLLKGNLYFENCRLKLMGKNDYIIIDVDDYVVYNTRTKEIDVFTEEGFKKHFVKVVK